jgi:DNA recombination protein RmuC
MTEWLPGLIGLLVGAALGGSVVALALLARRRRADADLVNARARVELLEGQARDRERQLVEERERVEQVKTELGDAFSALGAKALRANNEQFLDLAQKTFENLLVRSHGEGEQRRVAIEGLVKPIRELLERQATAVGEIERKREVAYRGLEEQIKAIASSHERLNTETSRLVTALSRPDHRGRWGEMQLRNAVELAGMTEHCDFVEQVTTEGDDGRRRPDMIVNLPGNGVIVLDAKTPMDAFLESLRPDCDRAAAVRRHARQVNDHAKALAARQYWNQFERTPKIVVMFMPIETALTAALEVDHDLHATAMRSNVLIATPTLLVALLRAVAFGWQQEDVAANAREISLVGKELYSRLARFVRNFEKVGGGLERATKAYNGAVGSLESRVLPSARELKRLHATTEDDVGSLPPIELEVRPFTTPELAPEKPSE